MSFQHQTIDISWTLIFGSSCTYMCVQLTSNRHLSDVSLLTGSSVFAPQKSTDLNFFVSAIQCPSLPSPANGRIVSCGNRFNEKCIFTCNAGYVLSRGKDQRTCTELGSWSGSSIQCDGEHFLHSRRIIG